MRISLGKVSGIFTRAKHSADRAAATNDAEALLSRADVALYAAKDAGRNTVRLASDDKAAETVRP